jgi:hypothetical protein
VFLEKMLSTKPSPDTSAAHATPPASADGLDTARLLDDGAEITIRAPLQAVWDYAGDSAQATAWSVYFHHITAQPNDAEGRPYPPDGAVDSVRVCYRRADETGVRWDEQVTALEPEGRARHRRIRTYNLRGLGGLPGWIAPYTAYRVEQHYHRAPPARRADGERRTVLAFRTRLARPGWAAARLLFRLFFLPEVKRIFALNLENMKAAIEAGQPYERLHRYEPSHSWE